MRRLIEIILGLDPGFLSRQGEFSVEFNPKWPLQQVIGAATWNALLGVVGLLLVLYVYRREGRSRLARVFLGAFRLLLIAFVILLLNRPVLTLSQSRTEPSVMAVMMDQTISMTVRDTPGGKTRMEAMLELLNGEGQKLVKDLAKTHVIKFYSFEKSASELAEVRTSDKSPEAVAKAVGPVGDALAALKPDRSHTQVIASLRQVLDELQGNRLAGVVLLTDARSTPQETRGEALASLRSHNVKVFPVLVGSEDAPKNVTVEAVSVQDSVFIKDIVNLKATVRGTGYPEGTKVKVVLKDEKTGQQLQNGDKPAEAEAEVKANGDAQEVEVQFKPLKEGTLNVVAEVVKLEGELDPADNAITAQVAVLDAKIKVLYVDGYPRWEYRYIVREMTRDKTVDISALLFSADPGFIQEGDAPIQRFPENMKELMDLGYDVIVFGDVDPNYFTDNQLRLVSEFVSKKGGGFGMVAGPRWAPQKWADTPIESILPVSIRKVEPTAGTITQGWRPAITREGDASTIFRFKADKNENKKFLESEWQPVFWYCRGVVVKPGVGEVYAEHPNDTGPDGRKAPVLTVGRFGSGRTLFSSIDDSWRWRFYTGEPVFDTYWVQQLRYLARSKKLGARKFTLTTVRPAYEQGEQVQVNLRVLDTDRLKDMPAEFYVDIKDQDGAVVRRELMRREGGTEAATADGLYTATWTADRVGKYQIKMPHILEGADKIGDVPLEVYVPRLELRQPQVDKSLAAQIAETTQGQPVAMADARNLLPSLITSAAKVIPVESGEPLWDAPLAMLIFVLLIALEWVMRKMLGML